MSTAPMTPGQLHQPGQPPRPERSGGRLPVLLSAMALILALLAAGVSLVALSRTGDQGTPPAPRGAAPPPPPPAGPTPTGVLPTDATDVTTPTPESTAEPTDGPDPSGVYTVAYAAEPLVLQPSGRYVDLDAPSGNASSSVYELRYSGFAPTAKLQFNSNVALASIVSPSPTANDCVQQLRRAPIDLDFTPSKGQQVCVLTSRDAADDEGTRQKVVLMKVNSVAADGTLNLTLSAWDVPH